jgi:hypothetical protein
MGVCGDVVHAGGCIFLALLSTYVLMMLWVQSWAVQLVGLCRAHPCIFLLAVTAAGQWLGVSWCQQGVHAHPLCIRISLSASPGSRNMLQCCCRCNPVLSMLFVDVGITFSVFDCCWAAAGCVRAGKG